MKGLDADDPDAARRLWAAKQPMSPNEYNRLRKEQAAAKLAAAKAAEAAGFESSQPVDYAEEQAHKIAKAVAALNEAKASVEDAEAEAVRRFTERALQEFEEATNNSSSEGPETQPANAGDEIMTPEQLADGRKRRERMARATKSQVAAAKFNAAEAKKHADKVVRRMEREGKL